MDTGVDIQIHMVGTRPLLTHNQRLANPLDGYTREIAKISKKRNKTDQDLAELMQLEARGGCYDTPQGLVGFPNFNVWRCIYDAAKAYKLGEDIKRALLPSDAIEPILVNGEKTTPNDLLTDPNNISYQSVVISRRRVMRARPIISDWSMTHTFTLLPDIIDPERLEPVLARAGRVVGVGDWRPRYGTFIAEVEA